MHSTIRASDFDTWHLEFNNWGITDSVNSRGVFFVVLSSYTVYPLLGSTYTHCGVPPRGFEPRSWP